MSDKMSKKGITQKINEVFGYRYILGNASAFSETPENIILVLDHKQVHGIIDEPELTGTKTN
jgi:hypothetical protein